VSRRIVPVGPAHLAALTALFERIAADAEAKHFHPHPFTATEAKFRADYTGPDVYALMLQGDKAVGYGMLRGWENNFAVPSLGIYVVEERRGSGAARALMDYLHRAAAERSATQVRLKVHPENQRARRLYLRLGYRFADTLEDGELVGLLELPPGRG
jgi:RimJ/RimL family protein N-acetyltransferase